MEEQSAIMEDFSDIEYLCKYPRVESSVGDQFQAELPELMSESEREMFLSDSSLIEQPSFPIMWIKKPPKRERNDDESDENSKSKKRRLNLEDVPDIPSSSCDHLEAVPGIPSSSWDDLEVDIFVLGLYTFGKYFIKLEKFMETKGRGDILFFYNSKFYNSDTYKSWSEYRKKLYSGWSKERKKNDEGRVFGRKLYSGWRLHELISRLIPSIKDEYQKHMLVQISQSFAQGNFTLDKYLNVVKNLVGFKLLVEAMGIGKVSKDLTVLKVRPKKTETWFKVSTKLVSKVPVSGAYTSLTSAEIITKLNGSRLTKALCNDIFWEAVWPRLLILGWHSEKLKSKDTFVYIVPDVKRFSMERVCRGEHINGDHYFDSISDIIRKVASKPELLEKVKDPSKNLNKRRAETEDHLEEPAKRRRLSACKKEEIISRETPMLKDLQCDDTNKMVCPESDQLSLCAVQGQNSTHEEMNEDKERDEIVLLGSSEQQQQEDQQINTDAPRRQSTRKRQMTTRALEAIESKRLKITTEPKKRERSTKKKHSAKVYNRTQGFSENMTAGLEHRGEDGNIPAKTKTKRKPLAQIEDSNHRFLPNEATTENPKLPRNIAKLPLRCS